MSTPVFLAPLGPSTGTDRYSAVMRITKLEHACLLLEKGQRRLYLDPGKFTTPITETSQVDAVVVTHEHDDHWTPDQLARIAARSPGVQVLTTARTAQLIREARIRDLGEVHVGRAGETVALGAFSITCFGGMHAEIHSSIPLVENLGVVVDGAVAYGGDAYDLPPETFEVDLLAVPANGPWMRIADSIDFVLAVRPRRVIGVHEMLLSRPGKELAAARLRAAAEQVGADFVDLQPYGVLDLDGR